MRYLLTITNLLKYVRKKQTVKQRKYLPVLENIRLNNDRYFVSSGEQIWESSGNSLE